MSKAERRSTGFYKPEYGQGAVRSQTGGESLGT